MPDIRAGLARFPHEWEDSKEEPPYYLALGDLARHLVEQRDATTKQFEAIFDVVERWQAATIGLLEGIQNNAGHCDIDPRRFECRLKPESKRWWDKLNRFWNGEGILSDN